MKSFWIVIDKKTNLALYGMNCITLQFNNKEEADNFGKQICFDFISVKIEYKDINK